MTIYEDRVSKIAEEFARAIVKERNDEDPVNYLKWEHLSEEDIKDLIVYFRPLAVIAVAEQDKEVNEAMTVGWLLGDKTALEIQALKNEYRIENGYLPTDKTTPQ